jgi:hypothetical protein
MTLATAQMLQFVSLVMRIEPEPDVIELLIKNPELALQARKIDWEIFSDRYPGRDRARVHVSQLLAELDSILAMREVEKMLLKSEK